MRKLHMTHLATATTLAALLLTVLQGSAVAQQSLARISLGPRYLTALPLQQNKPTKSPDATGAAEPALVSPVSKARILYINSDTKYLPASVLEERLKARPEFGRLGLAITHDKREAELLVDVGRIFTRFTYSILDPTSFYVYEDGLVSPLFGTASDKIAKRILATLTTARKGPQALDGGPAAHKYRYSDVDMPVSLAVGAVRTPEFVVKRQAYFIMLQAEKRLPFHDQECMMALPPKRDIGPQDCSEAPLLQADWTVFDDGRVVAKGTSSRYGSARYKNQHIYKFLGGFVAESEKKYVVEVRFTKDGTPLNVCNPHLIVISVANH